MSLLSSRPDARRVRRFGRAVRFFDRVVKNLCARRHGACSCRAAHPSELGRPAATDHRLTRLDDPDGRATLVGLCGMVHRGSLDALRAELDTLRAPHAVYLDFHAAIIASQRAMEQLARLIDDVELAGLAVRVVGISPDHPALRRVEPAD